MLSLLGKRYSESCATRSTTPTLFNLPDTAPSALTPSFGATPTRRNAGNFAPSVSPFGEQLRRDQHIGHRHVAVLLDLELVLMLDGMLKLLGQPPALENRLADARVPAVDDLRASRRR